MSKLLRVSSIEFKRTNEFVNPNTKVKGRSYYIEAVCLEDVEGSVLSGVKAAFPDGKKTKGLYTLLLHASGKADKLDEIKALLDQGKAIAPIELTDVKFQGFFGIGQLDGSYLTGSTNKHGRPVIKSELEVTCIGRRAVINQDGVVLEAAVGETANGVAQGIADSLGWTKVEKDSQSGATGTFQHPPKEEGEKPVNI